MKIKRYECHYIYGIVNPQTNSIEIEISDNLQLTDSYIREEIERRYEKRYFPIIEILETIYLGDKQNSFEQKIDKKVDGSFNW